MRRREFMVLVVGGLPFRVWAQQNEPIRRIAMLMPFNENDAEGRRRFDAVREGLRQFGWGEGRNLPIEARWLGDDPGKNALAAAADLVQLAPELIFAATTAAVRAITRATTTIPIVFAGVADPVGTRLIQGL